MKSTIEAGYTQKGLKELRKFDLTTVTEVILDKEIEGGGGKVDVTFKFSDGDEITVIEALSTGYRGEGSWGLHDVLIDCGFSEEKANYAFTCTQKGVHILVK